MHALTEITPNKSWPVKQCSDGWEYNTTQVTSSIVIDVSTLEFIQVTVHEIYCDTGTASPLILPVTLLIHR
jgi:hypothetical protein